MPSKTQGDVQNRCDRGAASVWCGGALAQNKIKYALGDVIGIDDLPLLVAAERSKKRGVEVEITPFKNEDIATQAVINGQADIGQGTPYAAIEKVNVPIRFFVQLWSLQFFPVVANEHYKSWKDLDGQEIAVQGRGSGTEAIMLLMAKQHGIKYKNVSYVPGSQVRALALIKGNIRASILDATNKNFLMREAPASSPSCRSVRSRRATSRCSRGWSTCRRTRLRCRCSSRSWCASIARSTRTRCRSSKSARNSAC